MVPNTGISSTGTVNSSRLRWYCFLHVAEGILGALAVELVDGNEVGEIQHVDLFQLAGGAELRRHDVERSIHVRHDGGVALADARSLDHDKVEAGQLAGGDDFRQGGGNFRTGVARRQRTHVDVRVADGVHADAIAEQCAAGALAGGIDGDHGDLQAIFLIEAQAPDELIGEAGSCPSRRCR